MADAEAPGSPPTDANRVLELFAPLLDSLQGAVTDIQLEKATARTELEVAQERLTAAQAKVNGLNDGHHNSEQWLRHGRRAALAALANTTSPLAETFVAQTIIEGGSEDQARSALENIARVGVRPEEADARQRLIVIGSFPVKHTVLQDLDETPFSENSISFVDVASDADHPVGLTRAGGRHYLAMKPQDVRTIPLSGYGTLRNGSRDIKNRDTRVVHSEPLTLRVVRTETELAELLHGAQDADKLPMRYEAITVGTQEDDSLHPAVIVGEAVDQFTTWLAQSEWLRAAVFAATVDGPEWAKQVPALPEGSKALEIARREFLNAVGDLTTTFITVERDSSGRAEEQQASQAQEVLSLSRELQEYLGITDAMLAEVIAKRMEPFVSVRTTRSLDDPVKFENQKTKRYFSGLEDLSEFVETQFQEAGFHMTSTSTMARVNRELKLHLLRELIVNPALPNHNKDARQFRARITEIIRELETKPPSDLVS